jgi:uncharacterized membrane protein YkgB
MSNTLTAAINAIKPFVEETPEYRWYYNEYGDITTCSMQNHSEDKDYIVVDKALYKSNNKYYVLNGEPKTIPLPTAVVLSRLIKSDKGFPVVKGHASILIEENETDKDIEYYDNRDS